jgi:transcriptional regulator with XRE-family HTH domain
MPQSTWGMLLETHMRRTQLTQSDIAKTLGVSQPCVSDWQIGAVRPPLQHLTDLAELLGLFGAERLTFVEEAYLAHAPDRVRNLVADLRARIIKLERAQRKSGLAPGDPGP